MKHKIKLRPYQRVGIYLMGQFNGRVLLADEQGLGKTLQVLEWLRRNPKKRPVVIVCPASVKYVWEGQAREHCNLHTTICYTRKAPKKQKLIASNNKDIFIINYDILIDWCIYLRKLYPQVVIFDEVHNIKNRNTLRTKAARLLCSPIRKLNISKLKLTEDNAEFEEDASVQFKEDNHILNGYITSLDKKKSKVDTKETPNYFRAKIDVEPKSLTKIEIPTFRKTSESVSIASVSDEYLDDLLKLETLKEKQVDVLKKIKQIRKFI